MVPVPPELTIKTHYEKLDIAGSNTVFTSFSLPAEMSENDDELMKILRETEQSAG